VPRDALRVGKGREGLGERHAGREERKALMEFRTLSRRDAFRNANLVEIEDIETSLYLGPWAGSAPVGSVCSSAPFTTQWILSSLTQAHTFPRPILFFTNNICPSCVVLQIRNSRVATNYRRPSEEDSCRSCSCSRPTRDLEHPRLGRMCCA
jgi:hypothetical protein